MSAVPFPGADVLAVAGGLITLVTFAAVVKMWRVISRDARERGISERAAEVWAFGVSYLAPLVAPVYLVWVVRSRRRETPMSTRDRWVVWLFCSLIVSFVASATLTHPGTFSQTLTYFAVFPPLALGVYVLLFWKRHLRSPEQPA